MKRTMAVLTGLIVFVLCSTALWAQGTAQISGTVKDQSGAVLPGVEVTATHTGTGVSRNTVTNETGNYVLPNLLIGPYRLEAALPGFRTFAQTGIVLQVNSSPVINPVLEVGQVSETVEVQANAAMVETRTSGVGQVIENQRILELPLNGRQVTDLVTLVGVAVQSGQTRDNNSGQLGGSPFFSVGGGLGFGVAYTLDGANHQNFINSTAMPMPFPDALQEFKVETSGLGAQHGKETSVNSVTKSGNNEFHGDLFEFVRNDLFNARNYFAVTGSTLKRHQFGGTLGGAIIPNKLFFFGGYQRTTIREDPANLKAFLPTPSALAGDWTGLTSAACNAGRTIALRPPFANNRIDPATYSKPALNLLSRVNMVGPEPCGEITYDRRNVRNENQFIGRIDFQQSAKQSIFGRVVATKLGIGIPASYSPGNFLTSTVTGQDNLSESIAFGDTYLFSANTVNAFRASFNRLHAVVLGPTVFSACDLGVKMYCGGFEKSINLTISGGFAVGSRFIPRGDNYDHWTGTSYQIGDDLSLVRGTHQFAFGGNALQGRFVEKYLWWAVGPITFTGQATNLGLADFMLGQVTSLTTAGTVHNSINQNQVALYAADTWKVNQRLTLNYGVRWEPFLPQFITDGRAYNFDYAKFQQGIKSTVYNNAPAGFRYTGDAGFPRNTGLDRRPWQFAPRVGLAWDPKGDGRTSVRASYAFGYDYVAPLWREDYSSAAPWTNAITVNAVPFDDPWRGFPGGGNPFPLIAGANAQFLPYTQFQAIPEKIRTPNTSSWNLSLQRQVTADWLVSASYIGTTATHIWSQNAINPAIYFPGGPCTLNGVVYTPTCSTMGNTNQRRRLSIQRPQDGQFIGPLSFLDDGATQSYNGLLLNVQRRAARGVTAGANYTLSHCIGDYADLTSQGPDANETYTIPNNRKADRGNCNTDRRHLLNLTALAETPSFGGPKVRAVVSGWRLAGIYRWSTGAPVTIINGTDRALNGIVNQRANQVLANPYGDKSARALTSYINSAAFSAPDFGTVGNVGRNSVYGPGTWSFDMALSRTFRVAEARRLEVRTEAFNVTNSFRPSLVTLGQGLTTQSLASNTFGQVRQALDPRILQFALKYVF